MSRLCSDFQSQIIGLIAKPTHIKRGTVQRIERFEAKSFNLRCDRTGRSDEQHQDGMYIKGGYLYQQCCHFPAEFPVVLIIGSENRCTGDQRRMTYVSQNLTSLTLAWMLTDINDGKKSEGKHSDYW